MTDGTAEFAVVELRDRAGEDAFSLAGADVIGMDGPHEDEWSLYTMLTLDDGRELETILHHRVGKPLSGECSCAAGRAGAFCGHLVWVGLTHLDLAVEPRAVPATDPAPDDDLRAWLGTLTTGELIDLVIEAAEHDDGYRHRLNSRAQHR